MNKQKPAIRFKGFSEAWEQRELGEVSSKVGDGLHGTPDYNDEGNVYFINGNNLIDGRITITPDTKRVTQKEQSNDDKKLNLDTILMSINGTIGNLAMYTGENLMLGKSVAYITVNNCNKRFIYTCLQTSTILNSFTECLTGTTIKNLGLKTIRETKIKIPQEAEQTQIGKFFTHLDHLITLHQHKLEKLKNIKKAMLEKMFPKNGENIPEIRFKGFSEAWEQRELGEIADRVTRKNTELQSTLPLTISAQYGLINQITYFNNRVASTNIINYYLLKNGEFAYNKSSSDGYPFGVVKRLDFYENGVLSTLYIVFALKNADITSSDFIVSYYDTDNWHKGISEVATEGARNHGLLNISAYDFMKTTLMIPNPIAEQQKIGTFFTHLDHLITLNQNKLEKLKNIKKAMLEKMFP